MKQLLCILCLFLTPFSITAGDVRVIYISEDVAIEKDGFKEIFIRNLCEEEEIYQVMGITLLNDHIFLISEKPTGVFKLNLLGKTIARAGRRGEGPGEFKAAVKIKKFKGKLLCLDFFTKILFYDRELKFLKEMKFTSVFQDLVENNEGNIVCPLRKISQTDKYLAVYSEEGELIRSFGEKPQNKSKRSSADFVFNLAYDPEKNGIWAAFGDRYDLSYYEKEKLKVEIKRKNGYYKEIKFKDEKTGYVETVRAGRPIKIDIIKDKVYYFYRQERKFYCDTFNKNTYKLLRRIKLERYYRRMAHYKDGIFYALYYGFAGEEDYQLYRLELK